jgi:general secretion pathway protein D
VLFRSQATLKLLQQDVRSEVVQAPKINVLDGTPATIFVGETIRYAEAKSEQGQAGGLQLSLAEAGGSPVEVGFQLLIVPHVVPGTNTLTMDVIPKETSLSGTGSSALAPAGFDVFTIGASGLEGSIALPRTRSSTIVTTMMVQSGQTMVIGGLTSESDTKTESRVPGLSSIPLLGELFKYEKTDRQRRSLLVFLTPTVMHTSADAESVLQRELLRRKTRLKDEIKAMISPATQAALDAQKGQ